MYNKSLFHILVFVIIFLHSVKLVAAAEVSVFTLCSGPVGIIKVYYGQGTHGIADNPGEFTGSDKVY